jgi:vancomycin resistance protein VanW
MRIVKEIKIFIKLKIIFVKDLIDGNLFKFATKRKRNFDYNSVITIKQEIKPSETFENKIFNLSKASKKINDYEIMPGELFSFWKIIGNPNYEFKKGRTLLNGKIKEEIGGGICQVSGIVYNVSLIAGLQIIERYNHSVDIYTDETRFAPLGLDATVVFGYKDLRIRNNYNFPIKFEIQVHKNQIQIELLSTNKIKENKLFFEKKLIEEDIIVKIKNENNELMNSSKYKKNIR